MQNKKTQIFQISIVNFPLLYVSFELKFKNKNGGEWIKSK